MQTLRFLIHDAEKDTTQKKKLKAFYGSIEVELNTCILMLLLADLRL
jgi:hypothetical protein